MNPIDRETHLSEKERSEVLQNATERLGVWRKRFVYSGLAFFFGCVAVVPFSAGHTLHDHAEPFGRLLVYLSMGLFLVFVYCGALFWGAWSSLRDSRRE
jgi:uncharacterized RDD family membrane protein YckC